MLFLSSAIPRRLGGALLWALLIGSVTPGVAAQVGMDMFSFYGEPVETTVGHLEWNPREYHGRAVRIEGRLERLMNGRLILKDGVDKVMLLPVVEMDQSDLFELMTVPVEIVGVARELPDRQATCTYRGQETPESKCRDPLLPVLPDRGQRLDWPKVSVSYWAISDATPIQSVDLWESPSSSVIENVAAAPESFDEQNVTVVGQFRGANLFGDLPVDSRRKDSDWVIADGPAAVWVTGKKPKGRGWQLDLHSKSDSRWWMEVVGEVEAQDGVTYIRAREVSLRPAPAGHRE
jgi:hypothetical protein